jgi:hypothetical protein
MILERIKSPKKIKKFVLLKLTTAMQADMTRNKA